MTEPLLSIVGGGLVAALITIGFNVWWDKKKEKSTQDWEFRSYRANLIHGAAFGLMDAFFAAKTEIEYLVGTLSGLLASLEQLSVQADAIVRQQGGPQLTVAQLEQRKAELLQPFQNYNQQFVNLRWNQYEQKVKDLEAKAESYLSVLEPIIPAEMYREMATLLAELSADYEWIWRTQRHGFNCSEIESPSFKPLRRNWLPKLKSNWAGTFKGKYMLGASASYLAELAEGLVA